MSWKRVLLWVGLVLFTLAACVFVWKTGEIWALFIPLGTGIAGGKAWRDRKKKIDREKKVAESEDQADIAAVKRASDPSVPENDPGPPLADGKAEAKRWLDDVAGE